MSIFKKLGWFFKQEKKVILLGFSLMMVALVQLVPPKVIGVVVDEIVNKEIRLTKIIVWVALLIGAGLAQYSFRYIWRMHIWGVRLVWKKSYGLNYFIISQKWIASFIRNIGQVT